MNFEQILKWNQFLFNALYNLDNLSATTIQQSFFFYYD